MMDSVLILGAASLQVPLINFVKAKGYRVIVASIDGDYPGFKVADRSVFCDVRDYRRIIAEISDENIVAVLTDQTDIAVPTVARIADYLGLNGNDIGCAETYSNKRLIRETCQRIGVPSVRYFTASSKMEVFAKSADLTFPVIVKPEDNQGSRGVKKVFSRDELIHSFDDSIKYSSVGNVIVEEFFPGNEYVVEGFCYKGKYMNFGIAQRRYFDLKNIFIPSQTIFPASLSDDISNRLLEAEKLLHQHLKPQYGMIHSEWLYNDEIDQICLVETSLRGGGVYISSDLVPLFSGIDNYSLLLDSALNRDVEIEQVSSKIKKRASAYMCFYLPDGVVDSIIGLDELSAFEFVKRIDIQPWISVGAKTQSMSNKTQRLGPIILEGEDRADIDMKINMVKQVLSIFVRKIDGTLENIKWE